jgi:hypothetical protein
MIHSEQSKVQILKYGTSLSYNIFKSCLLSLMLGWPFMQGWRAFVTLAVIKSRVACYCFVFLFCLTASSYAQKDTTVTKKLKPKIEIIARPLKDSILLRWAPNNSLLWEEANKTGYIIERITILRDEQLLPNPEHKILTPSPLMPLPLDKWENAVKRNKYAAIAAQALFGETFDVKNKTNYDVYSVITKVKERDTRFSFALFVADQSPEVAKLSGLWLTDTKVRTNEKYLYRVFIAQSTSKVDTGFVYTGSSEYQELPKPLDLKAEFSGRKVTLTWNNLYFEHIYTAYILERSEDGKLYRSVTDEPIVNMIPTGKPNPQLFYKTDSLPEYNKKYYYRIKGINSFGEISEPSEIVSGEGHNAITFTPYFTEKNTIDNQKVYLKWVYPVEKNNEISGFKVSRSSNPKNGFKYIEDKISPETREYIDARPTLNNYYIISATNRFGDEVRSLPVLVQLIDSMPPSPPVNLQGSIDTTGKVTLRWKANTEDDIDGYRLYRANYAGEEYSQITTKPITDTCFIDSVTLKTLTKSAFYKVMAIDLRQNHSGFSKPLELKRPDRIAPVSPVFKTIVSSPDGVYLEWFNSTSTDVRSHLLYRSITHSKEWKLLAVFNAPDSVTRYNDKEADSTDYCSYTLIARDESNLESKPATPVKGKKIDTGIRPGIDKVFVDINREKGNIKLAWKRPKGNIYRYIIYRAKGSDELAMYTSIPGNTDSFTDEKLQPNTHYQYSIKILYADGGQSGFSKKTEINY